MKHCKGCSHPTICNTMGCAAEEARANKAKAAEPSYAELKAQRDELLGVVKNFEIQGPDDDGFVWLVLHGNGTRSRAMFNLGKPKLSVSVAQCLEEDRRAAIAKVEGGAL